MNQALYNDFQSLISIISQDKCFNSISISAE